jgi:hypothetical protein
MKLTSFLKPPRLLGFALLPGFGCSLALATTTAERPNVIVIVVDDLGWAEAPVASVNRYTQCGVEVVPMRLIV